VFCFLVGWLCLFVVLLFPGRVCPSRFGFAVPVGRNTSRDWATTPFVFATIGGYVPLGHYKCQDGDSLVVSSSHVPVADAVLFQDNHGDCTKMCATRAKTEVDFWILESLEAPRCRQHEAYVRHFDVISTYRSGFGSYQHSYAWYFAPTLIDVMRSAPVVERATSDSLVFWSSGNCNSRSGREYFIAELMRYVSVSIYGSCMNNRASKYGYEYERLGQGLDAGDILFGIPKELAKRHLFYLSFENSNCDDYVTEKLWKAFYAGVGK
jgi:hypothetical protein